MEKKSRTRAATEPDVSANTVAAAPPTSKEILGLDYVPSAQSIIVSLNDLAERFSTATVGPMQELARSFASIQLPDYSRLFPEYSERLKQINWGEISETYKRNLEIIKNQGQPPAALKEKVIEMTVAVREVERALVRAFLEKRVHEDALRLLNEPHSLLVEHFLKTEATETVVLSADIRRSTELMLKATDPPAFADFIARLTNRLKQVVIRNNGVFDKFTGDGILAYFPYFYTEETPVWNCLNAAFECHEEFKRMYRDSQHLFATVMVETGLGIGIDHGKVNIVAVSDEITVVGRPVVYACRLSGAPAGQTYVNQGAYNRAVEEGGPFTFDELSFNIKNEGPILVRKVSRTEVSTPKYPSWRGARA